MTMTETPTDAPPTEHDRRQRLERAHSAADHLSRVNGEVELRAAVLALLLPAGSRRAVRAWRLETKGLSSAPALLEHVASLPGAGRLPWLETLVSRMRGQPLGARQRLLEATRRVMAARGVVRPIDRLHWLAMRQRLGGESRADSRAAVASDLSRLPESDVMAIAAFTAFLSRMVPVDEVDATPNAAETMPNAVGTTPDATETETAIETAAPTPPGEAWYETVMTPWRARADVAPCSPPDSDGLVHALQGLQALAWMHRPVLVRKWFVAALQHSPHGRLGDGAADALRLCSALLDSPLPPELARHYAAAEPETAR